MIIETRYQANERGFSECIYVRDANYTGSALPYAHPFDHTMTPERNHVAAARMFCLQRDCHGSFVGYPKATGFVFVLDEGIRFEI